MSEVEDLDDAGIGDRGRGARFVEESRHDVWTRREARVEHLDRRPSLEQHVDADPDFAHPARADALDQPVRADLLAFDHRPVTAASSRSGWSVGTLPVLGITTRMRKPQPETAIESIDSASARAAYLHAPSGAR